MVCDIDVVTELPLFNKENFAPLLALIPVVAVSAVVVILPVLEIEADVLCMVLFPDNVERFPDVKYVSAPAFGVVTMVEAAAAKVALEHVPKIVWVNVFWPVMVWAVSVVTAFAAMLPFARETSEP